MIIANNVASKLFVAFVAAAMLFTLATPAKAATAEELQAQIAALTAQIAALTSSTDSGAGAAGCTFTRALTIGSEGSDVNCLQNYLTSTGHYKFSGGSTGYFGGVTASAVAAWQGANGVSPASGYFGPVSQAKYNALVAMDDHHDDDTDDTDDSDDSSDDEDDSNSGDLSGEASLDNVEVADGDESDDAEEGSEDVQVGEITVEFADGDAMITRLDIALDATDDGNDDVDPWDTFEDVSLWVDGDEVAREDASDEDNYLDEDLGTIRFSGLDIVGMEDEEVVITVAVTIGNSVDGVSDGADWDIAATGLRYVDADDVTSTESTTGDLQVAASSYSAATAEFTIDEAGAGDELDLETSDSDPESTTFELSEDNNTEEMIFAFDLSAEDSDGDIDLNEIQIGIQTVNSGENAVVDDLVNDFRIEIDGDSYSAESYTGTATTTTLVFDIDGDTTVAADDVVTVMLYADFENMDEAADEGSEIYATTSSAGIDAEGIEDVTVTGSATVTGETHTLRTEGMAVTLADETVTPDENSDTTNTDDSATFVIEMDVAAFGDTLYIPFGPTTTTGMTDGVKYQIIDSNGDVVSTGTSTASLDVEDGDAEETNSYKITDSGETLILTVEFDPLTAGSFRVEILAINFATTDVATATDTQDVSDLSIRTGLELIQQ